MRHVVTAVTLVALLAGCSETDPLISPTAWQPMGANDMNIAAEVANPADLVHGRETAQQGGDGQLAAAAILRLYADKVKKLPDSAITDLQVQSSGSQAGGS